MEPAILKLLEVGLLQVPFQLYNPYLFFGFWAAFLLAGAIQWLLLKKCQRTWTRWSFVGLTLAGLVTSEVLCQVITGWDLILYMVLYGLFLTFALAIALVCFLLRKR